MVKLTISHAIAQSVKMTLFEDLVDQTINDTKHIPQIMAETGKVNLSRHAITSKIGQLFIVRINVNLVSNILDTPEIFWSEPAQQPLYNAIRGYLEISQRVELLNQRVTVINDLLEMLKDHLNSSHGETLEYIVIILIGKTSLRTSR
ncbi:sporulation protein rmd1 [Basidiobolus ranarum]|uniref:Sporulation protein rmd1 n=1 Tax=Basidiobolus ranarum TaxID=34480 RepID=A0ABR2W5P7_9FUNG